MMRGTSPVSTISKPSSPIVQAMSYSPSLVSVVPNRSRSSPRTIRGVGRDDGGGRRRRRRPTTTTIWSGELLGRMCRLHSSVHTTSTTASGCAAQNPLRRAERGERGGAPDESEVVPLGGIGQTEVAHDAEIGARSEASGARGGHDVGDLGCRHPRLGRGPPARPAATARARGGCTPRCAVRCRGSAALRERRRRCRRRPPRRVRGAPCDGARSRRRRRSRGSVAA